MTPEYAIELALSATAKTLAAVVTNQLHEVEAHRAALKALDIDALYPRMSDSQRRVIVAAEAAVYRAHLLAIGDKDIPR